MKLKKVIMLQRYVARQFPSRYRAAQALIEARLNGTELDLDSFDYSSEAAFKRDTEKVPCQTWVSPEQAKELDLLLSERSCSLSELVRETLG